MGRHANPLLNPAQYAAPQLKVGPPSTAAAADRSMPSYDYSAVPRILRFNTNRTVIVGAGAAGCVLANKLSEDERVSVLLLEAGGDNAKVTESRIPAHFTRLFHGPHDWDYYTTEQTGVASRKLYWPRGRVLGGSTSMNAMMYHHCSKSDFDEWESAHGCVGWGYDDLLPYLSHMEHFTQNPLRPAVNMLHRGKGGPWQTGYSWLSTITEEGFLPACNEAGIGYNRDVNTPKGSLGVTRIQTTIDAKGQRSSMATAFLTPEVLRRPNLYVACHIRATRVLFDRLNDMKPTAIGVELQKEQGGELFQVHARREVILSAGAINTPQTLILSGIGPARELAKHRIAELQENSNVGRHLKDHLASNGVLCKAKAGTTLDYLNNEVKAIFSLLRWLMFGTGPLTSNVFECAAFVRSFDHNFPSQPADNTSGDDAPDLEIVGAPLAYIHHGEEKAPEGTNVFTLTPVALRPRSSGTITLRSTDVFDSPIIDPRYLSDKENNDRKVLVAGLRMCLRIMRASAFRKFLEPVEPNDDSSSYWWPYSASDIDSITDDQLARYMEERAFTLYHPVGTARMGPSPATSVIDLQCRVHGVSGLRVVDASVFPEQVSGHPTAPIAAIAYKMSDVIRDSWRH